MATGEVSERTAPEASAESTLRLPDVRVLSDSIASAQRQLENTRLRLDELAARSADIERREQSSIGRLNVTEERIRLTEQHLRQLAAQVAARNAEVMRVTTAICSTSTEIEARRSFLARRLVSVYKYSRTLHLQVFLSTQSVPELYRRVLGLRRICRADRRALEGLDRLSVRLDQQREQLLTARQDMERLMDEMRHREAELEHARDEEAEFLRRVREERAANHAVRVELEQSAQNLQGIISDLINRRAATDTTSSNGFARLKGMLPWPVAGRIVAGFGAKTHPRYQTRTTNLGVDIRPATPGSASVVAAGQVVFADRFLGYGNLVIVDHGGGFYTLYGDLAELSVTTGVRIAAGSAVGMVSDYLHFEIRKGGQPVDPLPWLRPDQD